MNEVDYNASVTSELYDNEDNYMKEYFLFKKFVNRTLCANMQKIHIKYPHQKQNSLLSFFGLIKKLKTMEIIMSKSNCDDLNYNKKEEMSIFSNFTNVVMTIYIKINVDNFRYKPDFL